MTANTHSLTFPFTSCFWPSSRAIVPCHALYLNVGRPWPVQCEVKCNLNFIWWCIFSSCWHDNAVRLELLIAVWQVVLQIFKPGCFYTAWISIFDINGDTKRRGDALWPLWAVGYRYLYVFLSLLRDAFYICHMDYSLNREKISLSQWWITAIIIACWVCPWFI